MAIAIDQATVLSTTSDVGDDPTNFTTTAACASNSRIIICIFSNLLPTGITGTGGLTFSLDRSHTNTDILSVWSVHATGGLSSGGTISVDFASAPNFVAISGLSFTGVATSSALDQVNSRSATNEQSWSSSSVTPAEANTVVVGFFNSAGGNDARSTPDAGFTEAHDIRLFGDNRVCQYKIVSDTSATNPSGAFAATQTATQIGITTNYKAASSPPAASTKALALLGVG